MVLNFSQDKCNTAGLCHLPMVPTLILFVSPGQSLNNRLTDSAKNPAYFQAEFHLFKSYSFS